jgi:hypothetical protein
MDDHERPGQIFQIAIRIQQSWLGNPAMREWPFLCSAP